MSRNKRSLIEAIDFLTNSLKIVDNDHEYIHRGKLFIYNEKFDLATTASKTFAFTTPATLLDIHYRPEIITTSADKVLTELIEAPTISAAGTNKKASVFNANRKSSLNTAMQTFASGSTIANGTVIHTSFVGGGTGVGATTSGSATGVKNELVLANNTIYAVKVTNSSSNTNTIHIQMQWYEEEIYSFS
jgi:hypothetical protein